MGDKIEDRIKSVISAVFAIPANLEPDIFRRYTLLSKLSVEGL